MDFRLIYCAGYEYGKDNGNAETDWIEDISESDLYKYNAKGYGIYRTINMFTQKRKIESDCKIISWAIDIDGSDKIKQFEVIKNWAIEPSKIIESKKGFHVYFDVNGYASKENYTKILKNHLIPMYSADKAAKDITRVLRVPEFYHLKGEPFLIKIVYESRIKYSESKFMDILQKKFPHNEKIIKPVISASKITAREIAVALGARDGIKNSYVVRCPAHDDKNPSCRITQTNDGILFYCMSGCSQASVLDALKKRGLWK